MRLMLFFLKFNSRFAFINSAKVITSFYNPFKCRIMHTKYFIFSFLLIVFTSCSNSYKTTQTPDDVYYSPISVLKVQEEVTSEQYTNADERQIRMSKYDRRWNHFNDDYNYQYNPYQYGYGYYYNPFYSPYPAYHFHINQQPAINSTPRTVNLNSYIFHQQYVVDPKTSNSPIRFTQPVRHYNNSNQSGNTRTYINPSQNTSAGDNNTRTYSPSSGNHSSSSSTEVVRPKRG